MLFQMFQCILWRWNNTLKLSPQMDHLTNANFSITFHRLTKSTKIDSEKLSEKNARDESSKICIFKDVFLSRKENMAR